MKSRRPPLDLADVPAAWAPNVEFAMALNAGGALAPAVEPYLNRVMSEAARQLDPKHGALKDQIRMLVRQETEHYKLHTAFNEALYAQGFEQLEPVVAALKAELNTQFRERSFAFNLAYCVGFETYTLYLGQFLFGPGALHFDGADPRGVDLWRWHLAEEYEHRTICHDAYRALVGDYPLRVRATIFVYRHITGFRRRAMDTLTGRHRAGMTAPARIASRQREGAFAREMAADMIPRLVPAFAPFYDPARARAAQGVIEALDHYPEAV